MLKATLNSQKQISVIIVTYNSKKILIECIQSILNSHILNIIEIIVVDNNSDDKIEGIIERFEIDIKFIPININVGFARACNQGIKIAEGEYIFLLNPDTMLLNDSISIFYNFLEQKVNQYIWCVGAQLFDDMNNLSKSFGHFPNLIDVFAEQFGIKGFFLKNSYVRKTFKTPILTRSVEVPFIIGCNMFIRRNVLDEIGLFDERFFLNYEETELACRATKAGYKCMVLPEAKIMHYSGKSFIDLRSYLSHLWYGQLVFFKLTHSKSIFYLAKVLHLTGSFLRVIFKLDKFYWIHLKKIWSIKL